MDDFFDKGFSSYETSNSDYSTEISQLNNQMFIEVNNIKYQLKEIIIFNSKNDYTLRNIVDKVKLYARNEKIYEILIKIILSILGKEDNNYKFNKFMSTQHKKRIIKIGDIRFGLNRHKSLLFKFLCDNIGLNCCVIRNNVIKDGLIYEDHCWNIILINSTKVVVDFKRFPGRLVVPNNQFTKDYYQLNLVQI